MEMELLFTEVIFKRIIKCHLRKFWIITFHSSFSLQLSICITKLSFVRGSASQMRVRVRVNVIIYRTEIYFYFQFNFNYIPTSLIHLIIVEACANLEWNPFTWHFQSHKINSNAKPCPMENLILKKLIL